MKPTSKAKVLEARRVRASKLLERGKSIAEVARLLGVHITSVKRWKRTWKAEGVAGLAAKPHPGAKPKLSERHREQLVKLLVRGPAAAGYSTELWTCRRVTEQVQKRFGVSYHPDHLGRILHDLGFTPQKPERKARERDEEAIRRWRKEDWPRIKKREHFVKLASCLSTNPASVCSP
ncbi:MAG: IS630 family transposase [Candidatus Binatia bacterium]